MEWQAKLKRLGSWLTIVATLIITIFLLTSLQLPTESFPFRGAELTYGHGVKAALFALASGGLFIVSWLPERQGFVGLCGVWINRVALAGTFFLTGWYWLRSAVKLEGYAWDHLSFPLFGTLLFTGLIVLFWVVVFLIGYPLLLFALNVIRWFRYRKK